MALYSKLSQDHGGLVGALKSRDVHQINLAYELGSSHHIKETFQVKGSSIKKLKSARSAVFLMEREHFAVSECQEILLGGRMRQKAYRRAAT